MNKLIVICGPTAVGKTDFAFSIAPKIQGELISADSRQIYIGMDIGTGKDIPKGAHVWLTDIIKPTEQFGSGIYQQHATKAINEILESHKTPILVGGTGFYINSIIRPSATQTIPPNPILRQELNVQPLSVLQRRLQSVNSDRWLSMNHSDQNNPHRLIRAIEVAMSQNDSALPKPLVKEGQTCSIGLTAPVDYLIQKIQNRVSKRMDQGFENEVRQLMVQYPDFASTPGGQTMGYQEWTQFLNGSISQADAIESWTKREIDYMKRQLTWFKKQPDVVWFDITSKNWYAEAVEQLETEWNKV